MQCKHHAHSGKAVNDSDVGVWQNAMARYKARGYLLVTDTRATENLRRSFQEYSDDEANSPKWATFSDVDKLIAELDKQPQVRDAFFPPRDIKRTSLEELALEVRQWLEAIRYTVTDMKQIDERCISMIATFDEGTIQQKVLVHCIGGEIVVPDVDLVDRALSRKIPQGWLISDQRVSAGAQRRADGDDSFQVFTLSGFLKEMVWGPYFDVLQNLVLESRIPELYVDLGCYRTEMDEEGNEVSRERHPSLDAHIDAWLLERGKIHMSLLGEFGNGKTWFCRHYASRQLERYLNDPVGQRLPILITLRTFAKSMTAQQLINDAFMEQYKLPFVGSAYNVFQEMNRRGKILLILDGFDEMARRVNYQTVVDNFWELANLVADESKVILTSRTEYFRWAKESEKILGGQEYGRQTIVLSPPRFEVLHIEPFTDDQIHQVIVLLLGQDEGPVMANRILSNPNLAEMARKPVLVKLLLAALEEASPNAVQNTAQIYLYATNRLLLRNIAAEKTFTSTADKLYFLCELAWGMIETGTLRIHYADIPDRIKAYFGDRIKDQQELDTWDFDLRNQTLLHRDSAGYYEFAHKSLAEYFVALKFASELGCLAPRFYETYLEADGNPCKPPIERKAVTELGVTFGAIKLTDERLYAVRDLMREMLSADASRLLLDIVLETRGMKPADMRYLGGNASTWVSDQDFLKAGKDLSKTVITGFNRRQTDFSGWDFTGAVLSEADFFQCSLAHTSMEDANLQGVSLSATSLVGSKLCGADVKGLRLRGIEPKVVYWSGSSSQLFAGTEDGSLWAWDTTTWAGGVVLSGLCSDVCSLTETSDGKHLLFADRGNTCVLWDVDLRKTLRRFRNPHGMAHQIDLSPDGQQLACVDNGGKVVVFDLLSGNAIKSFPIGKETLFCVCFSRDGQRILAGDSVGRVTIWDLQTGKQCAEVGLLAGEDSSRGEPIYNLRHSRRANRAIFAGSDGVVSGIDSITGDILFKTQLEYIRGLSYSPDESRIAAGDILGKITLLDSQSGQLIAEFQDAGRTAAITFSPDGRYLVSANAQRAVIQIWDSAEESPTYGKCIRTLGVKANFAGTSIIGAKGLEGEMEWHVDGEECVGTLLEYFAFCGAELDEYQKREVAKLQKQRKNATKEGKEQ